MAYDYLMIAAASLTGLVVIAHTMLKGWQGWLNLKLRELDRTPAPARPLPSDGAARIEVADLKERVRRLEAIAAGVDL